MIKEGFWKKICFNALMLKKKNMTKKQRFHDLLLMCIALSPHGKICTAVLINDQK